MRSDRMARWAVLGAAVLLATTLTAVMLNAPVGDVARGSSQYWGARILPPGPGPNGLPLIPVRVADDGTLVGDPTHLDLYRYCGRDDSPALSSSYSGDNRFRVYSNPEKVTAAKSRGFNLWWEDAMGKTLRADDFPGMWKAAPAVWRGAPSAGAEKINVIVMRVEPDLYPEEVRRDFVRDGFLAVTSPTTFMCCITGYEENDADKATHDENGYPLIYDTCHDNRYDPRDVRLYDSPPGDRIWENRGT